MEINYSECIKKQHNIGNTIYYNVCNNTTSKVNWGSVDYMLYIGLPLVLILGVTVLVVIIIDTIKN